MEELLASAGSVKFPVENKAGDSAILKVVEAYCAGGRGAIRESLWRWRGGFGKGLQVRSEWIDYC